MMTSRTCQGQEHALIGCKTIGTMPLLGVFGKD